MPEKDIYRLSSGGVDLDGLLGGRPGLVAAAAVAAVIATTVWRRLRLKKKDWHSIKDCKIIRI